MFLYIFPLILSSLVLGAHFLRGGNLILVLLVLATPFLLLIRHRFTPVLIQVLAYLGAFVWFQTAYVLIQQRLHTGQPWTRMALILGGVALFTALSGALMNAKAVKRVMENTNKPR